MIILFRRLFLPGAQTENSDVGLSVNPAKPPGWRLRASLALLLAIVFCAPCNVSKAGERERQLFSDVRTIVIEFGSSFYPPYPEITFDELYAFHPILVEQVREDLRKFDIEVWSIFEFRNQILPLVRSGKRQETLQPVLWLNVYVRLCCEDPKDGDLSGAFSIRYSRKVREDGQNLEVERNAGSVPFRIAQKEHLAQQITDTLLKFIGNDLYIWIEEYAAE